MSEKNTSGKRAARDRLAAQRQRQQAAEKRMRLLKVLGASAAVLGVVGLVGYAAGTGGSGDADRDGLAGSAGPPAEPLVQGSENAPATLTVYEDFRCAACGDLEQQLRDTIHELEADGTLRTEYHPVSILGGEGSRMAGNAAACAHDAGHFADYHALLFDSQPNDGSDPFADQDFLTELAEEVPGLATSEFASCVAEETHSDWVDRATGDFLDAGHTATPTVLLNGDSVFGDPEDPLTPERLAERVEELAAEAAADDETQHDAEPGEEEAEMPPGANDDRGAPSEEGNEVQSGSGSENGGAEQAPEPGAGQGPDTGFGAP